MAYTLVIAEKPSVARDIARVMGAKGRAEGYYEGEGLRVSWAIGHLVALSEPEEIDPKWKRWRAADLPILPETIPLKVLPRTRKQYALLRHMMLDADCGGIICATDAGREGELIFRYLYRMAGSRKPVRRLWISSMTDEAIREGFRTMRPGSDYDALYESARCRSEADWLVGMNASRAFTLAYDVLLSVGRVQTPTLALLVKRHHEIAAFDAKPYWTITADFGDYTGLWLNEATKEKRAYAEADAGRIADAVRGKEGVIERITRERKQEYPPLLYDLTSLQRDANRLLGFTAKKTLSVAQSLYEEHKLLTYPRTDSRHLPSDMAGKARGAMQSLPEPLARHAAPLLKAQALPRIARVFDDGKVTDHHAIIPTGKRATLDRLPADAAALFDLVSRRLLAAFYPAYRYDAVRVLTRANGEPFESLGREELARGWRAVYDDMPERGRRKRKKDDAEAALPPLNEQEARPVRKVQVKADKTKPPSPHTDASLLAAMEHAGRELDDEALRESMKGSGLGTPATRAAIIERLLAVGYAERKGKALVATEKGVQLIAVVPGDIASPETTGRWEKALSDIAAGGMDPDRFLEGIRRLSASLVEGAAAAPKDVQFPKEERRGQKHRGKKPAGIGAPCPLCKKGEVLENSKAFYCSRWKEGCALKIWKDAVQKAGGPALTGPLVARTLKEGALRGSTGTLVYDGGTVRFERGKG